MGLAALLPDRRSDGRGFWDAWRRDEVETASPSGQVVTRETALRLPVVYGCVSRIASRIGSLPVDVLGEGPTPRWVERPSDDFDRPDFIAALVISLLLDGTAFAAPLREPRGDVVEVVALDPYRVQLWRDRPGDPTRLMVDGIRFDGEMAVIRNMVMPGALRGISPIDAARIVLGLGLGAQDLAARFFSQGAVTPGVIQAETDLTDDQMRETRDQWIDAHGGSRRSHLPVVLSRAKWQSIALTQEQAQFLETRQWTDAAIAAQIFHMDPSLVGVQQRGSSLTYQTLETRNFQFLVDALLPIMVRIERALTRLLPEGREWRFNVDAFVRADLKTRYESYKLAAEIESLTGKSLLSVDEMRALEDLT